MSAVRLAPLTLGLLLLVAADASAQCPPAASDDRTAFALALTACLGDPNPEVRDRLAYERLAGLLRVGDFDREALLAVRSGLLTSLAGADPQGFRRPFAILALAEIMRTDRVKAWMTAPERQEIADAGAAYLTRLDDYRAFSNKEGFRHGVAHAADLAMQTALNPNTTKTQLDQWLAAMAAQVAPQNGEAYWAGEPDRLARAVLFIAQRKLHADADWKAWFEKVTAPSPLAAWGDAFGSESGIKKRHNVRAFLLSVFATAVTSEDAGIKQLLGPVRESLKQLQ